MARYWHPPVEFSAREQKIVARCKKTPLFEFFRVYRSRLFDEATQAKLLEAYPAVERGKPTVPPAMLALATLMQAAFHVADHEVVTLTVDSQRWQMALDCLGAEEPPFSQGTLFNFRQRLIAKGLDRYLLERTVALARETGGFGAAKLKAAFDASPLWGAGRVEDTFNLIGHAAWQVVRTAAERQERPAEEVAVEAGIPLVAGSSIKAGLDLDWDEPDARRRGLQILLDQVRSLSDWLDRELASELDEEPLKSEWKTVQDLIAQDTEPDPDGGGLRIKEGVAKDRRISVCDPDMRHGRKNKSTRIDGFKRHVAVDLDHGGMILAVALTAANQPEREGAKDLLEDVERQGLGLEELYIDRGYLGAEAIEERRGGGLEVLCKPYPVRNGVRFNKEAFDIDLEARTATCPAGVVAPATPGQSAKFPAIRCNACSQKDACTTSSRGRSLAIHPQEAFHQQLRQKRRTPEGRRRLRQRVKVEHRLAALGAKQGERARYKGLRKNLFDLRRHAAVHNLQLLNRLSAAQPQNWSGL